jgi:hypothetical protein
MIRVREKEWADDKVEQKNNKGGRKIWEKYSLL